MDTEKAIAAVGRLQEAVLREGALASTLRPELGVNDSHNVAVRGELLAVQAEARAARRELIGLGVLDPGDDR